MKLRTPRFSRSPGGGAPIIIPAAAPFFAALTAAAFTAAALAAATAAATTAATAAASIPLAIPVAAKVSPIVFLFLGLFHYFLGLSNAPCEATFFPWHELKAWFASLAAGASCTGTVRGIHACWYRCWLWHGHNRGLFNTVSKDTRLVFRQLEAWPASLAAGDSSTGTVPGIVLNHWLGCWPWLLHSFSVVYPTHLDFPSHAIHHAHHSVARLALGTADLFINREAACSIELGSRRGLSLTFAIFIHHVAFIALKAAFVIVLLALSDIDCGRWLAVLATYKHKFTTHRWQGVSFNLVINLSQVFGDVMVSVSRGCDGHQSGRKECDFHSIFQCCEKIILIKTF